MTPTHILSAIAAGAFALAAPGGALAQTPYGQYGQSTPYGSFTTSCRDVEVSAGGYVSAICRTEGGSRWSAIRYVDCRGDLANREGVLTCAGATATVGPFYAEADAAYPGTVYEEPYREPLPRTTGPQDVLGALLGAVFGDVFGDDRALDDDWERGRRPLGERHQALEARIEAGVRDGSISRSEASRLRSDFDALVRLEARYAADGRLTVQERDDLRARYRILSRRIGDERADGGWGDDDWGDDDWGDDGYGRDWRPLRDREAEFEARIEAAVRARTLDWRQARQLDEDFETLVRLEDSYQRGGLDRDERARLERDYLALLARIPGGAWDGGYDGQWLPISGRRAEFDAQVDAAVRARTVSRMEAMRLRTEFTALVRLESDYQRGGLSAQERADLAARYADLQRRAGIVPGYGDGYGGGYQDPYGGGQAAALEARIAAGERSGAVSRAEAARLRTELGDVARLEAAYASDGLSAAERDYLSRRYADLDARITVRRW